MTGEAIEEEEEFDMTPDRLDARIATLLETCTYTVYNYTRRGLFDRDKLIVLTLLTFQILLRSGKVDAAEYDALCKGVRSAAPPPITDDLSRWMSEGQWAAADALAAVPGEEKCADVPLVHSKSVLFAPVCIENVQARIMHVALLGAIGNMQRICPASTALAAAGSRQVLQALPKT